MLDGREFEVTMKGRELAVHEQKVGKCVMTVSYKNEFRG
jgi:hypothetical protein